MGKLYRQKGYTRFSGSFSVTERPQNKNLKPFVKGQSGNIAGKPRHLLTTAKISSIVGKFCEMTREQLQKIVQNPKSTMLEITVAGILARAAKDGDYSRLEFLFARSVGKVKESLEVSTARPYIVHRPDGSALELGMTRGEAEEALTIEGDVEE